MWPGLAWCALVNEPRDHFFAGARLAGQQHGRVGRRDLRCPLQHLAPLARLAGDVAVRVQLHGLGQHLDARFELFGACACLGELLRRLG
jgi:hypothetical protein